LTYTTYEPEVVTTVLSVLDRILRWREEHPRTVVLIGGSTHAGKTTLARLLTVLLGDLHVLVTALSNDLWLVGGVSPPGMTPMEYVNADRFADDIGRLVKGEVIRPPVFNFQTGKHERDEGDDEVVLEPRAVLILDGTLVLNNLGLEWLEPLKIYVAVPDEYRQRWIEQCDVGIPGAKWGHQGDSATVKASRRKADIVYQQQRENLPRVVVCKH